MNIEEAKTESEASLGFPSLQQKFRHAKLNGASDDVSAVFLDRADKFAVTRSHHHFLATEWLEIDPDRAIRHIDRLAATHSNCPRGETFEPFTADAAALFDLNLRIGRTDAAMIALARVEHSAKNSHDWLYCAKIWANVDRHDEARRCIDRAIERGFEPWDDLEAADVLMQIGDPVAATARLEHLLTTMDDAYDLVTAARRCLRIGQAELAQRLLDAAVPLASDAHEYVDCAELAAELGHADLARAILAKVQIESLDYHTRLQVATRLRDMGESEAAIRQLQDLASPSLESFARAEIARAFISLDRRDLAAEQLACAIESEDTAHGWLQHHEIALLLDDAKRAHETLDRATESAEDMFDLLDCAKAWAEMGDQARSLASTERACEQARDISSWLFIARLSAEMGHVDLMQRAFDAAEDLARGDAQWIDCSDAYADYGDRDAALRCLRLACDQADSVHFLRDCADRWGGLVGRDAAIDCLRRAEPIADHGVDWVDLATHHGHLQSIDGKNRCMEHAMKCTSAPTDLSNCIRGYLAMGDTAEAERLIQQMRESATDFWDWLGIAGLDQLERAAIDEAMERAENAAQTTKDFSSCVDTHKLRQNLSGIRRCLERATPLASSIDDWLAIARDWHDVGESKAAKACCQRAVRLVDSTADVIHIAGSVFLIDAEIGFAQLEAAKAQLGDSVEDTISLALAWHNVEFEANTENDDRDDDTSDPLPRTTEFIERAESLAKTCQDHLRVGHGMAWAGVGDVAERLAIAESLAATDDDWYSCGFQYEEFLGDEESMERCHKRAESAPTARPSPEPQQDG